MDFAISCKEEKINPEEIIFTLDVYSHVDDKVLAQKIVRFKELISNELNEITLPFDILDTKFGVTFRILGTGKAALSARFLAKLSKRDHKTFHLLKINH